MNNAHAPVRAHAGGTPQTSHPADAEDEARLAGTDAHEAEAQLPVEPVLADEGDERQSHGGAQHVEDARHVVHVQLAGHDLVLLVVAYPRQPEGLQLLHLTWPGESYQGERQRGWETVRNGAMMTLGWRSVFKKSARDLK